MLSGEFIEHEKYYHITEQLSQQTRVTIESINWTGNAGFIIISMTFQTWNENNSNNDKSNEQSGQEMSRIEFAKVLNIKFSHWKLKI